VLSAQCGFQFLFVPAFYEEAVCKQWFLLYMPGTLVSFHAVIGGDENFFLILF
jgi:hypothetical protein